MGTSGKTDLRVTRTKEVICGAFEEMICEMPYEKITVKELASRARINRKTFYLHYETLDDLLGELQGKLVRDFVERTKDFQRPQDMDKITREFFMQSEGADRLRERLMCSGSYHSIGRQITDEIMARTWGADDDWLSGNPYARNIVTTFVAQSTIEIYKQWVADGKRIPLEDIIDLTSRLISNGLSGLDTR